MRTVRSAAWSRNRPRRRLAWLLLVILLVLIALVARVDAAPGGDPIDREDEEEIAGRSEPADRALAALTGGIARDEELLLGDRDDAGEPPGPGLGDGEAADAGSVGTGALAMLDAELAPGDATAGLDAADAAATAGAEEVYEQWMRHRRPSPWGRLDVGVSWRRRWSKPIHAPANRYDEVWLVATWRR